MSQTTRQPPAGPPAPSAHFLNNVLAAAASYVEEDPDMARDVLADLGAFLAYRLREDLQPVALRDELDFVRTYLRLERARFGARLTAAVDDGPDVRVRPLSVQAPLQEALTGWLREAAGPLDLRVSAEPGRAVARAALEDLGREELLTIPMEAS